MSNTVDWIWYGEDAEGDAVISFGRWAKHPCQNRYKLADIQPTEHDHPLAALQDRPPSEIMRAAQRAAETVSKWSPSKQEYAERICGLKIVPDNSLPPGIVEFRHEDGRVDRFDLATHEQGVKT